MERRLWNDKLQMKGIYYVDCRLWDKSYELSRTHSYKKKINLFLFGFVFLKIAAAVNVLIADSMDGVEALKPLREGIQYNQIEKYSYIHNWPLQPFSRDYGLASHQTTHVVCVNFIRERRDLQFNVDSERQIFEKLFSWQFYLLSEFLPEICWEEVAEEIFFFIFHFLDDWPGIRTQAFASNKPTHYLLDHIHT